MAHGVGFARQIESAYHSLSLATDPALFRSPRRGRASGFRACVRTLPAGLVDVSGVRSDGFASLLVRGRVASENAKGCSIPSTNPGRQTVDRLGGPTSGCESCGWTATAASRELASDRGFCDTFHRTLLV